MRNLPAILSCHTKLMAANWHLGDVGSTTDLLALMPDLGILELCTLLRRVLAVCARCEGCCARWAAGLPMSHAWENMGKHTRKGWCWFACYSAFEQNTMIKIRLVSRITILKEGNGKKLAGPRLRFCFFRVCHCSTLTKL